MGTYGRYISVNCPLSACTDKWWRSHYAYSNEPSFSMNMHRSIIMRREGERAIPSSTVFPLKCPLPSFFLSFIPSVPSILLFLSFFFLFIVFFFFLLFFLFIVYFFLFIFPPSIFMPPHFSGCPSFHSPACVFSFRLGGNSSSTCWNFIKLVWQVK